MSGVVANTYHVSTALAREDTLRGRGFLVAPAVLVREMVLNGELLRLEDIEASAPEWEGRQVTIDHPEQFGQFVTAGLIDVADAVIGEVHNVRVDIGKRALKADLWIDIELANRTPAGRGILNRLRSGEPLEVSTGYTAATIPVSGVFNGDRFSAVQKDIRPDHLALLPHDIGACSLADGCGAPRVNKTDDRVGGGEDGSLGKPTRRPSSETMEVNAMEEDRGKLAAALGTLLAFFNPQHTQTENVVDEEDDQQSNGQQLSLNINVGGTDEPCKCNNGQKENGMDDQKRADLIALLVNAESVEASEDELKGTPEAILKLLAANLDVETDESVESAVEDTDTDDDDEGEGEATTTLRHLDRILNRLEKVDVDKLDKIVANFDATEKARTDEEGELRKRLAANSRCKLDEAELQAFNLESLKKLDASLSDTDYSGMGLPRSYARDTDTDEGDKMVSNGLYFAPAKTKEA